MFSFARRMLHCSRRRPDDPMEGDEVEGGDIVSSSHSDSGADITAWLSATPMYLAPTNYHGTLKANFQTWLAQCRLDGFVDLMHDCVQPDLPHCLLKVRIPGNAAEPNLDRSPHGRPFQGVLYHGTVVSHLPAVLSAGCLLRSSVPTRGYHAIWSSSSHARALMYAPWGKYGQLHGLMRHQA
jgi:hypothetical protein